LRSRAEAVGSRGAVTLGPFKNLVVSLVARTPAGRSGRALTAGFRVQIGGCAPVAQGTEQRFPKPRVGGSSPSGGTSPCTAASNTDRR
jgi:hypothetical protein